MRGGSIRAPAAALLVAAALGCLASSARAEKVILQDSLLGKTIGTQVGGMLTPEGYRPAMNEHILYQLPRAITRGYIELQVTGMKGSVGDNDPAFFVMYDGRGVKEPAAYSLDGGVYPFRENYFRFNLHWRGDMSAFKIALILTSPKTAANVDPKSMQASYYRPSDAVAVREFVSEPNGKGVAWDPAKTYTLRTDWGPGGAGVAFKASVDGTVVVATSGPYPYSPGEHRIWIGSGPGKYAQVVAGITFKNVKLVSMDDSVPAYTGQGTTVSAADGGAGGSAAAGGSGGSTAAVGSSGSGGPASTPEMTRDGVTPSAGPPQPPSPMTGGTDVSSTARRRQAGGCRLARGAGAETSIAAVVAALALVIIRRVRDAARNPRYPTEPINKGPC